MKNLITLRKLLLAIACITISFHSLAVDIDLTFNYSNFGGYNISCHGGNDGSVEAVPIGGWPPYFYLWSNGSSTKTISNLYAGTYSVTVTDFSSNTNTCIRLRNIK